MPHHLHTTPSGGFFSHLHTVNAVYLGLGRQLAFSCTLGALLGAAGCESAAAPAAPATPQTAAASATAPAAAAPLALTVKDIAGQSVDFKSLRGKVLLVVNVASECGYTPQYAELQQLYARYQDRGLVVLGFPSNDFGGQEPGDNAAIAAFAHKEYGVTFPLFDKLHATGSDIAPLYQALTSAPATTGPVKWNFTKFLVDKGGVPVARFESGTAPMDAALLARVEALLAAPAAR